LRTGKKGYIVSSNSSVRECTKMSSVDIKYSMFDVIFDVVSYCA